MLSVFRVGRHRGGILPSAPPEPSRRTIWIISSQTGELQSDGMVFIFSLTRPPVTEALHDFIALFSLLSVFIPQFSSAFGGLFILILLGSSPDQILFIVSFTPRPSLSLFLL